MQIQKVLLTGPGSIGHGAGARQAWLLLPKKQFVSLPEIMRISSAHSGFCLEGGEDKECDELNFGTEVYFA